MKGTTNSQRGTGGGGEKLVISLKTNQASHEDLIGAKFSVVINGNATEYTWQGTSITSITIPIPSMLNYTVEFGEVEGYAKPESVTHTAVAGNDRFVTGTYNTESVTVNVSADNGILPDEFEVTITDSEGNVLITSNESAFSIKIPYNTVYTVSASDVEEYFTPASQTFTASESVRDLAMVYKEIQYGVFIQGISGNLYTGDEWDSQETVNGIAVLTENCKFVVATINPYEQGYGLPWGGEGTKVDGITTGQHEWVWQGDYDGEAQTTTIIESLSGTSDEEGVVGAPAAEFCRNYTFPNGKKGYLGAAAEFKVLTDNFSEFYELVKKFTSKFNITHSWTSTQYDSERAWRWVDDMSGQYKSATEYVIPFCSI